jgi:hypothetical protein
MSKLDTEYDLVFIVDSLSDSERTDFRISEDLMQFLSNNGIRQLRALCSNKRMVLDAIEYSRILAKTGLKFCLQIVSHGTEEGLWIDQTGEDILWVELTQRLSELNTELSDTLIINMTSCKGLNGIKIVDEKSERLPFFGLVGCPRDLWTDEAKLVNEKFYNKLLEAKDISSIVAEIQTELAALGKTDVIFGISSKGYKTIKMALSKA